MARVVKVVVYIAQKLRDRLKLLHAGYLDLAANYVATGYSLC